MKLQEGFLQLNSIYFARFLEELAHAADVPISLIENQNSIRSDNYLDDCLSKTHAHDYEKELEMYPFIKAFQKKVIKGDIDNLTLWNTKICRLKLQDDYILNIVDQHIALFITNQKKCFEQLFDSLNCKVYENNNNFFEASLNLASSEVKPMVFVDASSKTKPKTFSVFCNLEITNDKGSFNYNIDPGRLHYALEYLKITPQKEEFSEKEFYSLELYDIIMSVLVFEKFCVYICQKDYCKVFSGMGKGALSR